MNTGNYLPSKLIQVHGYRMVYVPGICNKTPEKLELLVKHILALLPNSYSVVLQRKKLNWIEDEVFVIGESNSYMLFVADDKDKTAVVFAVRPRGASYARDKINNVSSQIFEKLLNNYDLTVRIGPDITHNYVAHWNRAA